MSLDIGRPITETLQAVNPILDEGAMIGSLIGVKTEVSALLLSAMPHVAEAPASHTEMHQRLFAPVKELDLVDMDLRPSRLVALADRLPTAALVKSQTETGAAYNRTDNGELLVALGGHLLKLSKDSSVSTRIVLGEHTRNSETVDSIDPFQARIALIGVMLRLASKGRFVLNANIHEELELFGVTDRVANLHLKSLRKAGVVQGKWTMRGKHRAMTHRVNPNNTFYEYGDLLTNFLGILSSYQELDRDFLAEGHQQAQRIVGDERYVPFLVARTFLNSPHLGKGRKLSEDGETALSTDVGVVEPDLDVV